MSRGHQPLGTVPDVEVREVGRVHERRPLLRLELEDVGAEVAEDTVGERAGEDPREVDDTYSGQRFAGGQRTVVTTVLRGGLDRRHLSPLREERVEVVG
ncbi:MAG TPA: hypothetical protein VFI46_14295 [Jiangellaceae bacterium]|nr:hypothetical protein [Jiangellaceae bacterium]